MRQRGGRWLAAACLAATIAPRADAQVERVRLELRPHAGDTLVMRLDQVTEVNAPRRGNTPLQVVTTLRMFSRAIVESTVPASSMILAITDSVVMETTDEHASAMAEQTRRQLEGRKMRMQVWRDGTVTLAGGPTEVPSDVAEMVSVMPASFPREAIAVGDTWERVMPFPQGTQLAVPLGAMVRARFRLDSLGQDGDLAYLSMEGAFEMGDARKPRDDDPIAGTVSGAMIVNRRRGWLSESRFLVQMRATLPAVDARAPMRFRMKITQHMRTSEPKRP